MFSSIFKKNLLFSSLLILTSVQIWNWETVMEMVLSGSHHQSQVADFWTIWAVKSLSESSDWLFNNLRKMSSSELWWWFPPRLLKHQLQLLITSQDCTVLDNETTLSHVTQWFNNLPFIMSLNPVYRLFSMLLVEMSSSKQEHEPIHMSLSEGLSFKIGNTKKTVTALNVIGQWD